MGKKRKLSFNLIIGGILTGFILLLILLGLFAMPYDPEAMDSTLKFAPVSLQCP